jgi:type II secretory pathway pseudopilin PulG
VTISARRCGHPALRPAGRPDAGLTLIELMVALMVAFVALTVLAGVFVGALHTLTVAKQRQSATALGTRALEQMRALPFSTVTAGLSTNDLAGAVDPNVTGSPPRLIPAAAPTVNEELVTNGAVAPADLLPLCSVPATPLLPHRCTTTLDRVVYTVASYVSKVPPTTPPTAAAQYSLTTIVSWTSNATRGKPKTVVNRSRAFSPNGTCSPANHPFNTPCQTQYHAQAGLSEGGVTLTGLTDGQRINPSLDVVSAELSLPRLSSTTAVEQTVSVSGATGGHSARYVPLGGPPVTSDKQALSSAATDPSNSVVVQPTVTATAAPALNAGSSGLGGWAVIVQPEASGGWASTSRAAAGLNSGCRDLLGNTIDDTKQPCGSSSNLQTAEALLRVETAWYGRQLDMKLAGFGVPTTVGPPPANSYAFGARFVAPGSTWCPTASGLGCVAAGASRRLGSTVLGGLPVAGTDDVAPVATGTDVFAGAVLLEDYTGRVSTSSGAGTTPSTGRGAVAPTVERSGTLKVWNGGAYATHHLHLNTGVPATLPVAAVATYKTTSGLTPITVTMTGNVKVSPVSKSPSSCIATLCEASTGSVVAELEYVFWLGSASQGGFKVRADLGSLLAKTSFVAA